MKIASFWSGGKDSCLACYLAREQGHEPVVLLNMLKEDGSSTVGHLLDPNLIGVHSTLSGIPLLQTKVSADYYERDFKCILSEARKQGARGVVFGDISSPSRREWLETACQLADLEALFPLWDMDRKALVADFVAARFEAVVVATRGNIMGEEWLGRNINQQFINDLEELGKTIPLDISGEGGEYHSLVTAGPLFSQRIKVTLAQPVLRDLYWFADILGYEIE